MHTQAAQQPTQRESNPLSRSLKVGLVGATGLVGQEFLKILAERSFPVAELYAFASSRSAGKKVFYQHQEIEVQELAAFHHFEQLDLVFVSATTEVSKQYAPIIAQSGAVVIDDSSAFRLEPSVPLIVPEINADDVCNHQGILSTPNCSTVPLVMALAPLHKVSPLKRVTVATYQSVSGTGAAAVEELNSQVTAVLEGRTALPHVYPHQIAFNLLPEIDVFLDNGYTKEEWKMLQETRKIMHLPDLPLSATCVRVPVYIGHSEAVHAEFSQPIGAEAARALLAEAPGIRVLDEPSVSLYPQPWNAAETDEVLVGRIREDSSSPNGLVFWLVVDNLRKGAALNAIQIAEELLRRGLV